MLHAVSVANRFARLSCTAFIFYPPVFPSTPLSPLRALHSLHTLICFRLLRLLLPPPHIPRANTSISGYLPPPPLSSTDTTYNFLSRVGKADANFSNHPPSPLLCDFQVPRSGNSNRDRCSRLCQHEVARNQALAQGGEGRKGVWKRPLKRFVGG